MNHVAKSLVTVGAVLIVLGLIWQLGGKLFHLGKLPGDIIVEKERDCKKICVNHKTFYGLFH